jgi:hypothetical protein
MSQIDRAVAAITEDRRASYLFSTKQAAMAVGCHPNKFMDWWGRTQRKLIALYLAQPGETAAELMAIVATAEAQRVASCLPTSAASASATSPMPQAPWPTPGRPEDRCGHRCSN